LPALRRCCSFPGSIAAEDRLCMPFAAVADDTFLIAEEKTGSSGVRDQ
jgi:hypothetical protein